MFTNNYSPYAVTRAALATTNAQIQSLKKLSNTNFRTKMLRRKKSTSLKRTIKQEVELHEDSVHIVVKSIRNKIMIEMRFWCRLLDTNEFQALTKQSFDCFTQKKTGKEKEYRLPAVCDYEK